MAAIAVAFSLGLVVCHGGSLASAAAPEAVLRIPEAVDPGSGAGQFDNARDVAGNPVSGKLYFSDGNNARISEFTAWGTFVRAWGWDVAPEGSPGDTASNGLEVCTTACKQGVAGSAAGQLNRPTGMAVDGAGGVYVFDRENLRVQKFGADGSFVLMFGAGVNQGPVHPGNVCTAQHLVEGDTCGAGTAGEGDGQLSSATGNYLAYDPSTNSIVVGDLNGIQKFGPDGSFKSRITFTGELSAFAGRSVSALDVDATGNVYPAFGGMENVFKLSPAGAFVAPREFDVVNPGAVAVNAAGSVFATEVVGLGSVGQYVLGFESGGGPISGMESGDEFAKAEFPPGPGGSSARDLIGLGVNLCAGSDPPGNLYVIRFGTFTPPPRSYASVYGSAPIGCEPPPVVPPAVEAQYAVSVGFESATLQAQINPHFWVDTTYYLEYGTEPCLLGGCKQQPIPPGNTLTAKSVRAPVTTAGIPLAGLVPGTTYHYRFVAQSTGSSGEPILGVGGKPGEPGAEGTFETFREEDPVAPCPANEVPRTGLSEGLPDCRAYEMVSPLDKASGDIVAARDAANFLTGLHQSSTSGERFTYSASTSFGAPQAAPYTSQYIAERGTDGWTSEAVSPPRERAILSGNPLLQNDYKVFSADLCTGWLRTVFDPPLTSDAVSGYYNFYRRSGCGASKGVFATLTSLAPTIAEPNDYLRMELQGISSDGTHAVYAAPDSLPGTGAPANPGKQPQLYEYRAGAPLRFVCVLPGGEPSSQACNAGTADDQEGAGRFGSFRNAISADGRRIFWTASPGNLGPGRIFVRLDGASTVPVSPVALKARFQGASADGSTALFTIEDNTSALNGDLYAFNVDEVKTSLIAEDVLGLLGASEDASHVYFVSTEVLTGGAENSEGEKAQVDMPNLYLHEEDMGTTFIGTLASNDTKHSFEAPSPINRGPVEHTSRISPDGRHAVFMATASLTDYDNVDAVQGEPAAEVYLYDADEDELRCVSCNPSGARPSGRELIRAERDGTGIWVAAKIPAFERALYGSRVLADDGERVFFESYDALVPRDTNGMQDVYQWEAEGSGDCTSGGATFVKDEDEAAGGCLDLISSGQSPRESVFLDADPSGEDVFFTTLGSLVAHDYGLVDVYDARIGGGLPPPPAPQPPCQGEACQSPPPGPAEVTPASSSFHGRGNPPRSSKCAGKVRRARRAAVRAKRAGGVDLTKRAQQLARNARRCKKRAGRAG